MIHAKGKSEHTLSWKKLFAESYSGKQLVHANLAKLKIEANKLEAIDRLFPIQVPTELFGRSLFSNSDSVLRQYLPDINELCESNGYSDNPVGDTEATLAPGIIKKYQHRVLLITTNICPIHCRYCFRKNYPYPKQNQNTHKFNDAISFLKKDSSINEVILSGGDPLSLEDDVLANLIAQLEQIDHIDTLRIHTKYPAIIPERITPNLLEMLTRSNLNKVMVLHINHPDEITEKFFDVATQIKQTNTQLLNQSVLLNGVNNDVNLLIDLSKKLFKAGVLPYYLHLLDPVSGTEHFNVNEKEACKIVTQLKARLPGYLVPKLARETPGEANKSY